MWSMVVVGAWAQVGVERLSRAIDPDEGWTVDLECAPGQRVIGGGSQIFSGRLWLQGSGPLGDHAWRATFGRVPYMPEEFADIGEYGEISAVCANEALASCLVPVSATLQPADREEGSVVVTCPADLFVVGGGASLVGDAEGVGFQTHGAGGLLAPTTFVARARRHTPEGYLARDGAWGIEAQAWCGPADVVGALHRMHGDPPVTGSPLPADVWDEVTYTYSNRPTSHAPELLQGTVDLGCDAFLTGHAMAGVLWGGGNVASNDWWSWTEDPGCALDPANAPVSHFVAADHNFAQLAVGLETCGDDLPDNVLSRFRIGASVLWGVDAGSDGFVWVPGSGPVPVDPQPFREAFAASPVALTRWNDATVRDRRVEELRAALDAERVRYRVTSDIRDASRTAGVVIVVPTDEVATASWLARNRATLSRSRAAVIVFLEADGPGMASIAAW